MCRASAEEIHFSFSVHHADNIWDENQWSEEYMQENIPRQFCSNRLSKMFEILASVVPQIQRIVK